MAAAPRAQLARLLSSRAVAAAAPAAPECAAQPLLRLHAPPQRDFDALLATRTPFVLTGARACARAKPCTDAHTCGNMLRTLTSFPAQAS
jgi:hypothetical protein